MIHFSNLTAYERDILRSVQRKEGEKGSTVKSYLKSKSERNIHVNSFYTTTKKLEQHGMLVTKERDGEGKSYYLSDSGEEALDDLSKWHSML